MSQAIAVKHLSVRYAEALAVDDISFEVERGEVFALLGTNGAGKTTTLDVVEGYRRPSAGQVSVLGLDPSCDHDRLAPRMGIMLQEAGFFETLTVAQTVGSWRRFHVDPQPVATVLELVGLRGRERVRCSALSGGERRRLDFALALLGRPEILFLDEPTTGMDPEARRSTLRLVRDLVEQGTTVLLTTHYLEEAEDLADRVAIMHRGRIQVAGSLAEIHAKAGKSTITFGIDADQADLIPRIDDLTVEPHPHLAKVTVHAENPQETVRRLSDWAGGHGIILHDLKVTPGGLAQIFEQIAQETERRAS